MRDDAITDADPYLHQMVGDRFRLMFRIGHGGMGAVYRAEHVNLGSSVAVKVLSRARMGDSTQVERFRREAKILARVKDEHCVSVVDVGEAFGTLFIAMEFIDGVTLAEEQRITGPFDVNRAVKIIRQLLGGLAAVHDAGILHRDVKPQNIMITQKAAERDLVKLVDFGIAKLLGVDGDKALTLPGTLFGTPEYMSPEQALGEPMDERADIYSAGVVAYQLLLGQNPYRGVDARDTLQRVGQTDPPSLDDARPDAVMPDGLESVLRKMVAKDRGQRFATALDAMRAIAALPAAGGKRPASPSLSQPPPRTRTLLDNAVTEVEPAVPAAPVPVKEPAPVVAAAPPAPPTSGTDEWYHDATTALDSRTRVMSTRQWAGFVVGFVVLTGASAALTLTWLRPSHLVASSTPVPLPQAAAVPVTETPPPPAAEPASDVVVPPAPAPTEEQKAKARVELKRGLKLLDQGRSTDAMNAFSVAVELDDDLADAHLKLGVMHYRFSAYSKARHHYRRYLELRPDAENAEQIRGVLEALSTAP